MELVCPECSNLLTPDSLFCDECRCGLSQLTVLSFRWFNRDPKKVVTKTGKKKVFWKPKPLMEQLTSLLSFAFGTQLRRKKTGALRQITSNAF